MATKGYDISKIHDEYDKAKAASQAERYSYERAWFQAVLFYIGQQWIIYSPQTRKWKPRKIAKWVPRPVSNKFASIANTIQQVLGSRPADVRARPGSESPEDVAAATVADKNFAVLLKEAGDKDARDLQSVWLTLTGNVIIHPCLNDDPLNTTTFIQHMKCKSCGNAFAPDQMGEPKALPTGADKQKPVPLPVGAPAKLETDMSEGSCPKCGSTDLIDAVDDGGAAVGEDIPSGRLDLEVFSPFEVFMDLEAQSMRHVNRLLARRRYPVDLMRRRFNDYTIEPDGNSNAGGTIGLNLLRAIAYASGVAMFGTGIASGRSLGDDQNVTVDRLWLRPCTDFPQGLVAIYANDKLLNEKDVSEGIPYHRRDGTTLWPWHLKVFDRVPGRLFGRSPMEDLTQKQEQRNKLESLIQLIITRMASPHWLIPNGSGITEITGEPGQEIKYNAFDPRLKPELVFGAGPATSIMAWLEKIDKDMEEIAGVYEVLRGSAPPGVTAGTALRLLLERANTRFTPVLLRSEDVDEEIYSDLLCIFQEYGTEERINRIQGPGNTWEVQRFSNADIKGNVDIVVEAGSTVPKSTVGEQAVIQDLVGMQVIIPTEPNTQYKILEKFGSTNLLGDVDLNIRAAQRENWGFINEQKVPEMNPIIDLHPAHLKVHMEYALSSDYALLDEQLRGAWENHIVEHKIAMMPPPMPVGPPPVNGKGAPAKAAGPVGAPANPSMPPQQEAAEPPMPGEGE